MSDHGRTKIGPKLLKSSHDEPRSDQGLTYVWPTLYQGRASAEPESDQSRINVGRCSWLTVHGSWIRFRWPCTMNHESLRGNHHLGLEPWTWALILDHRHWTKAHASWAGTLNTVRYSCIVFIGTWCLGIEFKCQDHKPELKHQVCMTHWRDK